MSILNRVPIKTRYKEVSLLGDKFELYIKEEQEAQQIARFLLGAGLCELNARGFGFANYKKV